MGFGRADLGAAYRSDLLLLTLAQMAAQAPYGTVERGVRDNRRLGEVRILDVVRVDFTTGAALTALAVAGAEGYLAVTAGVRC